MNCNEMRELLSPYIDSLLEDEQAKEVSNHLTSCVSCKKIYDELQDITLLLNQSEELEVPEAFEQRLRESINLVRNEGLQKTGKDAFVKKRNRWRMASSIAAIFAVGILSYGVYNEVISPVSESLRGADQLGSAYVEDHAEQKESLMTDGKADGLHNGMLSGDNQDRSVSSMESNSATAPKNASNDSRKESLDNTVSSTNTKEDFEVSLRAAESDASDPESGSQHSILADSIPGLQPPIDGDYVSSQGVQNTTDNQFYRQLIKERLVRYNYQITEQSNDPAEEWLFKVFIFTDQDGNTYNNEILITGKDGEIHVENNENMRL